MRILCLSIACALMSWSAPTAASVQITPGTAVELEDLLLQLEKFHHRPTWCDEDCATFFRVRFEGSLTGGTMRFEMVGATRGELPAVVPIFSTQPAIEFDTVDYTGPQGRAVAPVYWTGEQYAVVLQPGAFNLQGRFRIKPGHDFTLQVPGPAGLVEIDVPDADAVGTGDTRGVEDGTYRLTPKVSEAPGEESAGGQVQGVPLRVKVERTFSLGRERTFTTQVSVRGATAGQVIPINLLAGEKVETWPKNMATVKLEASPPRIDWVAPEREASLAYSGKWTAETIALKAPDGAATETWTVRCDDPYRCTFDGTAETRPGAKEHIWEPLAGQDLKVTWQELDPLAGISVLAESVQVTTRADGRNLQQKVDVRWRTSSGALVNLTLPEAAIAGELTIDDRAIPILKNSEGALQVNIPSGRSEVSLDWQIPGATASVMGTPVPVIPHPVGTLWHRVYPKEGSVVLLAGGMAGSPRVALWSELGACLVIAWIFWFLARRAQAPLSHTPLWFASALGFALFSPMAVIVLGLVIAAGRMFGRIQRRRGRFRIFLELGLWAGLILLTVGLSLATLESALLSSRPIEVNSFVDMLELTERDWSRQALDWGANLSGLSAAGNTLPTPWIFTVPLLLIRVIWAAWAVALAVLFVREGRLAVAALGRYWDRADWKRVLAPPKPSKKPASEGQREPGNESPAS